MWGESFLSVSLPWACLYGRANVPMPCWSTPRRVLTADLICNEERQWTGKSLQTIVDEKKVKLESAQRVRIFNAKRCKKRGVFFCCFNNFVWEGVEWWYRFKVEAVGQDLQRHESVFGIWLKKVSAKLRAHEKSEKMELLAWRWKKKGAGTSQFLHSLLYGAFRFLVLGSQCRGDIFTFQRE